MRARDLASPRPWTALTPRRLGERWRQLRRDARFALAPLRGERPSPTIERPSRPRLVPSPPRSVRTRPVEVVRVVRETPDAVSLYLREADGSPLEFVPGQFLSFDVEVDGSVLRRAYSLASAALEGHAPHVTVKRVGGGRVSGWLNDHALAGMALEVLGPSGAFTLDASEDAERLVFIAGGSGITPIASIAETALTTRPDADVVLIYGNRATEDIIFRERLATLADRHPRFRLDHVLERPASDWTGARGRLDGPTLMARLEALAHVDDAGARYYLCGPSPMMDAARTALIAAGVDASRIREERFNRPEGRVQVGPALGPQPVLLRTGGRELELVTDGETLLEAGLAAGASMPFSCAMGGCAACKVKVHSGQVVMEEPNCLTRGERDQGYVLACVARAASPCEIEVER